MNPVVDLHDFLADELSQRQRILSGRSKQRHAVTLRALGELRRRTDLALDAAIREAAAAGYSNAAIAMYLGVSRQAVHKRLAAKSAD